MTGRMIEPRPRRCPQSGLPTQTVCRRCGFSTHAVKTLDHGIKPAGIPQGRVSHLGSRWRMLIRMTPSRAFISDPPLDASVTAAYEEDLASDGYINNSTRVWCWRPDVLRSFQTLRASLTESSDLSAPRSRRHGGGDRRRRPWRSLLLP